MVIEQFAITAWTPYQDRERIGETGVYEIENAFKLKIGI